MDLGIYRAEFDCMSGSWAILKSNDSNYHYRTLLILLIVIEPMLMYKAS